MQGKCCEVLRAEPGVAPVEPGEAPVEQKASPVELGAAPDSTGRKAAQLYIDCCQ